MTSKQFGGNDMNQLIRSSGSIGANYLEANDSLSKKDFIMRLKISRREAKETIFWLKTIKGSFPLNESEIVICDELIGEAIEIKKILSAIIIKSS